MRLSQRVFDAMQNRRQVGPSGLGKEDAVNLFLKKDQVLAFIDSLSDGQIFSVVFEKADGTLRRMQCKQGVQKFLKGGDATYTGNPDNVGVFDLEAKPKSGDHQGDYRCFNATRVIRIRGGGSELKATGADIDAPVVNARGEKVKV